MNIEEAKEKLHNMAYRDLQTKPYDLKLADVMQILNQIELNQPKPVVSQCVAEWYEKHKDSLEYYIWKYIAEWDNQEKDDFFDFMNYNAFKPIQTLVNMHQFGYEVEQEKRYKVTLPSLYEDVNVLHYSDDEEIWYFEHDFNDNGINPEIDSRYHTKSELEEAGFGGVFDNDMFEVVEVE